jgi:hypothetical protein
MGGARSELECCDKLSHGSNKGYEGKRLHSRCGVNMVTVLQDCPSKTTTKLLLSCNNGYVFSPTDLLHYDQRSGTSTAVTLFHFMFLKNRFVES